MSTAKAVQADLRASASPAQAAILQRFFKTGPGDYGEGDLFLGLKVPIVRRVARQHRVLPLAECQRLLRSPHHEDRLCALVILTLQFEKAGEPQRQRIFDLYLSNTRWINNWDLVDISAPLIAGRHLRGKDNSILDTLARSSLLWDRRIAMLATFADIRANDFATPLRIAELLVHDPHDLIHKAVGWMLREIAKRDQPAAESFLLRHCRTMPRTMLRYAIERFPPALRRHYMNGGRLPS